MKQITEKASSSRQAAIQKYKDKFQYDQFCDESIGDLIRTTRKKKHLTQKELASLSGITAVQLNRIEAGESIPSKSSLQALSAHICIPYTHLMLSAGYNNMSGEFKLFRKDGTEINTEKIICSIYRADSELLDLFQEFDKIATSENVEVLKLVLNAMRKEADQCSGSPDQLVTQIHSYFCQWFRALKTFIISSIKPMVI